MNNEIRTEKRAKTPQNECKKKSKQKELVGKERQKENNFFLWWNIHNYSRCVLITRASVRYWSSKRCHSKCFTLVFNISAKLHGCLGNINEVPTVCWIRWKCSPLNVSLNSQFFFTITRLSFTSLVQLYRARTQPIVRSLPCQWITIRYNLIASNRFHLIHTCNKRIKAINSLQNSHVKYRQTCISSPFCSYAPFRFGIKC